MSKARAHANQLRVGQSCTFQGTQVYDIPGKDYLHEMFEDHPEVAVQLWYDNNGSWRDRELKWLVGYLHAVDYLETKEMATRDVDERLDKLYGVFEVGVKHRMTIITVVYTILSKEDWIALSKWQGDKCLEEFEMFALLWIADNIDIKQYEAEGLFEDVDVDEKSKSCATTIHSAWAESLKGLRLQVPEYWWKHGDTGKQLKGQELWECEVEDVNLNDDAERYFIIKCIDPDDGYPNARYEMTYGDVKKYADTNQPDFSSFDLPTSPRESSINYIDLDHVELCKHTYESLSVASGSGNNTKVILEEYIYRRVEQIIECQRLTPAKQQELGRRFQEAQGRGVSWGKKDFGGGSIDAPLYTCACCGYRNLDCYGSDYQYHDLGTELDLLKMNDENREIHNSRIEQGVGDPLILPVNKGGETKVFETWKAYSVWPQDRDWVIETQQACNKGESEYDENLFEPNPLFGGKRLKCYHLHPEFVEKYNKDNGKVGFRAKLCSGCSTSTMLNTIPTRSIASGVDFGDYQRIGLEPLTLRERHIISKVRHCLNVIKIESNTGKLRSNHHSALKGCGIMFDHDSPQVVANLLTQESINGDVQLQFVGPNGEYDRLIAKAIKSANVSARAFVIYQWLGVLNRINEWYKDDDPLPDFHEFEDMIDECNSDLAQRAELTASEDNINIARDDIAAVRQATTTTGPDSISTRESGDDFPMRSVYLTSSNKTAHDYQHDLDHDFLVETAETMGVDVQEEKKQYKENVAKSFRERDPVNEFLTYDESLVKAHPEVFLLGTAYNKSTPRLNSKEREHLLLQFTTAAAACQPLIFHLFDQMQRFEIIRAVHTKTLEKKEFDTFVKEFMSPAFQMKLRKAVANPHSRAGKLVMKKVAPMLESAGKSAIFGALESARSKGEIMALGRRFGCAPLFLTFAIDDVNSATAIRMTMRSSNNSDYPSCVSGEEYEGVRNDFAIDGDIPIPKSYSERYAHLAKNPVGAALVYKKFVEDILSIIIGGRSVSAKRTTFTSCDHDSIGISGTNLAHFGKTETTGRGSLHYHLVAWGGISPDILELMSDVPELCKRIGSILESMYSASLDRSWHVADLTMKELRRVSNDPRVKRILPQRALQVPPDPLEEPSAFNSHVYATVCAKNGIHEHSYTCYKGTTGHQGCRLNKPSGLREATKPVMLERPTAVEVEDPDADEQYKYHYCVQDEVVPCHQVDTCQKQSLFAVECDTSQKQSHIPSPDPRIIVWEMKRPKEEPLNPLPLLEDVTRHTILQQLHEQMLPRISDDDDENRVLYDPPKDENCLIRAMLKGLERVKQGEAKGKTTKSVRVELMNYLIEHRSEKVNPYDSNSILTFEQLAEAQQNARDGQQSNGGEKMCAYYLDCHLDTCAHIKKSCYHIMRANLSLMCALYACYDVFFPSFTLAGKISDFDLANYARDMCNDTPFSCKRGGILEYNLFAKVYKVNVAIHQDTNEMKRDGAHVDDAFSTIHLLFHDEHYQLLRYDWSWPQFALLDVPKSSNESSNDGFVENRERWAVNQVDAYSFVRDTNNLFYNLMQGLAIVGASTSSKLSVGRLKSDLMQYLVENPDEMFDEENQITLKQKAEEHLNHTHLRVHEYATLIQDGCIAGTELEVCLFAKSKKVNVALYEKERESLVRRQVFMAADTDNVKDSSPETIHLLCHVNSDGQVYFNLFMPKLYSIMKVLRHVDTDTLIKIYKKVSKEVQGRNGLVVDYNPLLTALLGCNTNASFLGAKEQSRGALFYIGPYINKDGVAVIDALPLMLKAQEDVLLHPSVADDSGTHKRHVQHTLTRTLNKLNSQMEVSDTQAAGALLGLDARITSELFSYYDGKGYKNYILDELKKERARKRRLATITDEESVDEDSFASDAESEQDFDSDQVGNDAESGSEAESFNLVRAIQQVREMDVQQDGHVARAATALYGEGADDGDASGLDTDEEEDRDDIRNTSIRNPFIDDMAGEERYKTAHPVKEDECLLNSATAR